MREVTVVLEIEDTNEATWVWDAHLSSKKVNGVKVSSIHNGDLAQEYETLANRIDILADVLPCDIDDILDD